jgi:flavodoxin
MNVKALVVYFSLFGNTRRIAEAVAKALASAGKARALPIDELTATELGEADLVVVGSPTHYQNLPKAVRAALDELPRRSLRDKLVTAFDTSLEMWGPLMRMTAAHRVLPKLRRQGGKAVARPTTFLVARGEVPGTGERKDVLLEGELERARAWAASIVEQIGARMERAA